MILQIALDKAGDRAVAKTLFSNPGMIVSGHDDDRQMNSGKHQQPLHIAAGKARHLKIHHDAARPLPSERVDKCLARSKRDHVEIGCT